MGAARGWPGSRAASRVSRRHLKSRVEELTATAMGCCGILADRAQALHRPEHKYGFPVNITAGNEPPDAAVIRGRPVIPQDEIFGCGNMHDRNRHRVAEGLRDVGFQKSPPVQIYRALFDVDVV